MSCTHLIVNNRYYEKNFVKTVKQKELKYFSWQEFARVLHHPGMLMGNYFSNKPGMKMASSSSLSSSIELPGTGEVSRPQTNRAIQQFPRWQLGMSS